MSIVPRPQNEEVRHHPPRSPEREVLSAELSRTAGACIDVPVWAGAKRLRTAEQREVRVPHDHRRVVARGHVAGPAEVRQAIAGAAEAAPQWATTSLEDRASIFLRAAALLTGKWRTRINAACMLGQSKTVHQAEIDAICELADFWRFNAYFLERLQIEQPESPAGQWNRLEYRPLEGFVFAVTPFNFLAIAANLPTAPAMAGNVVVWKPATQTLLGCQLLMELLCEAGLPPGVINLVPGDGPEQGEVALKSPELAGIHFTGSTAAFRTLYRGVAERIDRYRSFPRMVGETGGKDFIVAHRSADVASLVTAIVRGGYEYQGQKCSAASRVYIPRSRWPAVKEGVVSALEAITYGDVSDFRHFGGALIDERAYERVTSYVELAKASADVLFGGRCRNDTGFFVEPTLVRVDDPKHRLMQEEIFGPLVTAFVYDDARWEDLLEWVDTTSPYALTGAVFANERPAITQACARLRHSAGNFYINDKPTGAVVGQQPFGGARASGTNDKAGLHLNLLRWLSPRCIKENFAPDVDYRYPFMARA